MVSSLDASSSSSRRKPKSKLVELVPYMVGFALLFIVNMILLAWALGIFYKSEQCARDPNIWCSDTWTCNNQCPTNTAGQTTNGRNVVVSSCFAKIEPTGLASCLYGPESNSAKLCFTPPDGSTATNTENTSCGCTPAMQNASNCMAGCVSSLADVTGQTRCCCTPSAGNNCTAESLCKSS